MMGASGCKPVADKKTKNEHLTEKNLAPFFYFNSGKFSGHFSKTAAPLHPKPFILFNFNKLMKVQTWVQVGCNGCKLGANFGGRFWLSPRNSIVKSTHCQTGCKGAFKNVPSQPMKPEVFASVDSSPCQLVGKNTPRMTLLESGWYAHERRTAKGIERPCSFSRLGRVLHVVRNRRKDGIILPHLVINCAVNDDGVCSMMRDSGLVIL